MNIKIRPTKESDYESVMRIMSQVQDMHVITFRHIESSAHVTRDVIFVDTMAIDEKYRGKGIGHKMFEFQKN